MSKGDYVVYERASKNEDRLFLETAKEAISEINEPKNWKKPRDPKKHAGGKNVAYDFKTMLLILLLMVYHRKEYREMESHVQPEAVDTVQNKAGSRVMGLSPELSESYYGFSRANCSLPSSSSSSISSASSFSSSSSPFILFFFRFPSSVDGGKVT